MTEKQYQQKRRIARRRRTLGCLLGGALTIAAFLAFWGFVVIVFSLA